DDGRAGQESGEFPLSDVRHFRHTFLFTESLPGLTIMANFARPLGFVLLGGLAGAGATYWLDTDATSTPAAGMAASGPKEPLYWVAPMDPNFKSDKPGKSPMGMDLIPVYEEGGS